MTTHDGLQIEQLFRELASRIDVGFALVQFDPPGYAYLNPAYLRLFGYRDDEPPPTPTECLAMAHPDDLEQQRAIAIDALDGRIIRREWRIIRRDGTVRWVSARGTPVLADDGALLRLAGVFEDVTERKATERELAQIQAQFDQFARSTEVGVVLREGDQALYLNASALRMFGLEPEAGLRRVADLRTMIHPDDVAIAGEMVRTADGGAQARGELRIVDPDGNVRWLRVTNDPVVAPDGGTPRVATTFVDITDLKEAEAVAQRAQREAESANAAKGEFLSRMSHELRTPLNAILGFGQLLAMDELGPEQHENVGHITRAGAHLLGLIDEILDLSRLETGAMRLSLEPVRVRDVVEDVVGLLRPLADDRALRVVVELPDDDRHVLADHQRLRQVVLNLVANAIKYNREGGEVRIGGAIVPSGRLRLTVADSGIGIADGDRAGLFQAFERLSAEQSFVEGTGLGLALSQQLMLAMGGTIGVTSRLHEGSTFWLELPTVDAPALDHAAATKRDGTTTTPVSSRPLTVLYVEDNLSSVKLLERVMARRPGVELMVAMQASLGLTLALEHRPDLVLLDLHLPDMPGEEVLRRLRADPRMADSVIVVLSADATTRQRARLLEIGATDYLTKPFDVGRLLTLIDEVGSAAPGRTAPPPTGAPAPPRSSDREARVVPRAAAPTNERLTEFVHDLNNLLGVIQNYGFLLAQDTTDAQVAADLEQIQVAAERAADLGRQLVAPAVPPSEAPVSQ